MKRVQKFFTPAMVFSFVITLFACNSSTEKKEEPKEEKKEEKKADETSTVVFTPFKIMMIKHTVADFDKWKEVYKAHDSMRQAYGISEYVIGRGLDNPNMVIVIDKITDVEKAKDFSVLPDLKEAMQKAGVKGKAEFSYVDVVRNDDTKIDQKERVMITHRVKDYDAWLKVYDSEGKEKRMANGLIDRGLGRNIDDPNKVYVVFAITDMEKAKARINSEELKNLMTKGGVEGRPQIFYYKRVD